MPKSASRRGGQKALAGDEAGMAAGGKRKSAEAGGGEGKKKSRAGGMFPTVEDIASDPLTQLANKHWAGAEKQKFERKVVEKVYADEIEPGRIARLTLLELSGYLEEYLWPNFDAKKSTDAHVLSIMALVNEKSRGSEGVLDPWACFHTREDVFSAFFERVVKMRVGGELSLRDLTMHTVFLIRCYASLEDSMIRAAAMRLASLDSWLTLSPGRLELELTQVEKPKRFRDYLKKKRGDGAEASMAAVFVPTLLAEFAANLQLADEQTEPDRDLMRYLERFVEFLTDLLAQLPTRRFFLAVYNNSLTQVKLELSQVIQRPEGKLLAQLTKTLRFYVEFEIDEQSGKQLDEAGVAARHGERLAHLQRVAFKHFPELKDLALANHGTIESRTALNAALHPLSGERLRELCGRLSAYGSSAESDAVLKEALIQYHEKRTSQLEVLQQMPLYPTEDVMFNEDVVPSSHYTGDSCLALPKLNMQFLTFPDYLMRNYNLYSLEACYDIRESLIETIKHVKPRARRVSYESSETPTIFTGWARMALPIGNFQVTKVTKPNVGEVVPAQVLAEIEISLRDLRPDARQEWDEIRKHDVLYLLTIRSPISEGERFVLDPKKDFCEQVGLIYARGCEVDERLDEQGKVIPEWEPRRVKGTERKFRLLMDSQQYQMDTAKMVREGAEDVYETFNLLVRRKSKENNFKAVLTCIRDVLNKKVTMPAWLHDVFLGYGDASAAHWKSIPDRVDTLDFKDTFLSADHLKTAFPNGKVVVKKGAEPPFKLTFSEDKAGKEVVTATPYVMQNMGPYPRNVPKKNPIPFTPTQTEAIRSGLNHGLTMVVGPPGTGKTDVAVQIVSNLYHSFPEQRTLIITHANSALNDIFEKIMVRDVDERYLLRLGHGAKDLATESEFTVRGRVDYMLGRRLARLEEVQKLGNILGMSADVGYTCETAGHFKRYHVDSRWETFEQQLCNPAEAVSDKIEELFPFTAFFADAPQPLFSGEREADLEVADGCYRYIEGIFAELLECRPFELLRTGRDRGLYLMAKQARVIAMTCTHAALKRHEFLSYGLKYDNLVMEEAAQVLEIETFIPMQLQENQDGRSRLKRVVLIGDHNQLPPVVQNMALQKYSHLEQSLFARMVRLGNPVVQLDMQGRARPELADLYRWRYKELQDLSPLPPIVAQSEANPCMAHDYQLIDVPDFQGQGEFTPTPHFFQNLGEAEYVVALFMYECTVSSHNLHLTRIQNSASHVIAS